MRTPVLELPRKRRTKKREKLEPPIRPHVPFAWTLFQDFNRHRARCTKVLERRAQQPVRDYVPTDSRLDLFDSLIEWCRQRHLDPRLWLYLLFRHHRWCWAPKLEARALFRADLIEKYRAARGLEMFLEYTRPAADQEYSPHRDISPEVEALKLKMQLDGQTNRCLSEAVGETLGYHPRSAVCAACPAQAPCADVIRNWVSFDILALRAGQITLQHAREQSRGTR